MKSNNENLLQATINLLAVKLKKKIVDVADQIYVIANEASYRFTKEWDTFQEEVQEEAERIKNESVDNFKEDKVNYKEKSNINLNLQEKIDHLRAKVSELSRNLEVKH